ncbi:hypothetical protein WR25_02193 [Diploscapter pachys]|uniref:MAGE domain-containing protein n=1 Tax=Diploscapter pachys TaxID=2018661 RepID=A0A2A2J933_9BILA|nr:hypothetical protein WR25_02193 [Diploscapter pachys]
MPSQRPGTSRQSSARAATQVPRSSSMPDPASAAAAATDNNLQQEDLAKQIVQYALYGTSHRGHYSDGDIRKVAQVRQEEFKSATLDATKRLRTILHAATINDPTRHRSVLTSSNPRLFLDSEFSNDPKEEAKKGFLLAILMFINMSQNPKCQLKDVPIGVRYETLWAFLTELGYEEGSPDPELGDLTKLIGPHINAEFIKKDWLQMKKHTDANDVEQIYVSWGRRAEIYIDQTQLLQLFCEIMGEKTSKYPSYMAKARREQRERKLLFESK